MPKKPIRRLADRWGPGPTDGALGRRRLVGRGKTFAEAMAHQGTVRLEKKVQRVPPPPNARRPVSSPTEAPAFTVDRDEDFFEGYRSGLPASTRARLGGTPVATLDLHRLDAEMAQKRVTRFLSDERALRHDLVLLVVGRGRHSPGGRGVLRSEVVEWLTTPPGSKHVLAFSTAPRELGGSGGVVVLLASPRRG